MPSSSLLKKLFMSSIKLDEIVHTIGHFFAKQTLRWSPSKVLCTSVSMRNASVVRKNESFLDCITYSTGLLLEENWVNVSKETFWQTLTISSYKWLMTTKSIRPEFFVIYSTVGFQVEKRSNFTVGFLFEKFEKENDRVIFSAL